MYPGSASTRTAGGVPFAMTVGNARGRSRPSVPAGRPISFRPGGCSIVNISVTPSAGSSEAARNFCGLRLGELGERPGQPFLHLRDEDLGHDRREPGERTRPMPAPGATPGMHDAATGAAACRAGCDGSLRPRSFWNSNGERSDVRLLAETNREPLRFHLAEEDAHAHLDRSGASRITLTRTSRRTATPSGGPTTVTGRRPTTMWKTRCPGATVRMLD